ncbi:2,3-bisphosphoglycerate-independent phosphoglycerate mutase [uncultured Ruminococcus sp.]|jgi:2,3-bisphosphoglycerate-independent phosphoglycerate mutase|uniref:2,3-bisphosphoglycerate-independent phosphoglycerate mutase n=1 Tax=uncultured Ruminococcus sp. TaxID=165186 RepID=UPI002666A29A|nr:2,3-bisphosphoglycerate-independent phosphoglycerate mutase [uncultured Ruminococcus sp.]
MKKPLILMILDGFGIAPEKGNAIKAANKPNIDKLFAENPVTQIGASGMDVGLPDGQMGNSEVGHTNMGAGRIVYQELTRITKTINEDKLKENEAIVNAMDKAIENGTALHLMGLLSSGGVHSHNTHLYGILELAKKKGLENVYVHAFLDGRDVPPSSAAEFMDELLDKMKEIGVGKVATVSGRYYAMDRDNNWDRVEKTYAAMVYGEGEKADCPVCAVKNSYDKGVTDEFVVPVVVDGGAQVKPNDSVIFFNFRPDRAREITRTFVDPEFKGFERKNGFFPVNFVCMTQYDATMPNVDVAFKPQTLKNTLGEYVSNKGMTQLRIAETEKYAHVTFFFNGGVEKQYEGEDRILVKSPAVATYDLQPEMSAYEVTDKLVPAIESGKYDMIILNYANCDMVGHTGVFEAAVKAVEAVDTCVGRVVEAIKKMGGVALITADHGNADKMVDADGSPFTAHTTNPVPFCVVGYDCQLREGGRLADIAPTMLQIMGLEQPAEMDGVSLIK